MWDVQLCEAEIAKLAGHVESMGGDLGSGWTAQLKLRTAGQRAGSYDTYFYAPDGCVYRSKVLGCCHSLISARLSRLIHWFHTRGLEASRHKP